MNSMLDILKENTQDIKDNLKSVKSVQRGVISKNGSTNIPQTIEIELSPIVPEKSFVILTSSGTNYEVYCFFVVESLTENRLTISHGSINDYTQKVGWQVVEFY